ncbi:nuclear receptor subfamily 2 group E member 1-like [Actinia tenebrosa]|uniref:Nuclear receptor subfamily 2 group E member 1-like n=1 Tax=Actinia tenebrosa TaxID=6105 RepID=A0A6P8IMU1_ACTTE|nr:nuclear receptor subfamily 2 group E member 1-like [Actinia tenebrosa]
MSRNASTTRSLRHVTSSPTSSINSQSVVQHIGGSCIAVSKHYTLQAPRKMDPAIPAADEKAMISQKRKRTLDGRECKVCGDQSTGKHYGVYSCDGCSGFFKRTSRRSEPWVCKSDGKCDVDKNSRNECKSCRLHKCLGVGMSMEGVFRRSRLLTATGSFSETFSNSSMNTDDKEHYTRLTNETPENQSTTVESVAVHKPLSALNTPLNTNTVIKSETIENPEIQAHPVESRDLDPTNKISRTSSAMETAASLQQLANSHCHTPPSSVDPHNMRRTLLVNTSSTSRESQLENIASSLSSLRSRVITTTHAQNQNQVFLNGTANQQTKTPSQMCSIHELLKAVEAVHFNSSENIQDAAMRLMTASIRFARNLPCFTRIPFRDQIILLEESWKKLFLLDAAYWALPLETGSLSVANDVTRRPNSTEIKTVQELLTHLRSFRGDLTELACLKAILIFKPETKGLKDAETVDKIQDEIQLLLSSHVTSTHPNHPARFGKLLLSLLAVQSVAEKPIEEILFRIADDKDIFETLLSKLIDS